MIVLYCPLTGLQAWSFSCGCQKSTESPRGPMCQYQVDLGGQAGLSIVPRVYLAWLSPLCQQRPTTETRDNVISWICLRSLAASLGVSAGTHTEYQSVCELSNTSISFIPQRQPPSTIPVKISFPSSGFFSLLIRPVPWNTKQRDEGLQHGGREMCGRAETQWVNLKAPHISALILLHPRQVSDCLTD